MISFKYAKGNNGINKMSEVKGHILNNVSIGTSDTDIVHSLGYIPYFTSITPLGNATVWIVSVNKNSIVLKASSAISVNLMLL